MKGLFEEMTKKTVSLKPTTTKGGSANLELLAQDDKLQLEDEKRREYFFQSSVDKWYEQIADRTFPSAFIPITKQDAEIIIDYWNTISSKSNEPTEEIPSGLNHLVEAVDRTIQSSFAHFSAVFVKLSTRSPKDSKTVFRKAELAFSQRVDEAGNVVGNTSSSRENGRLVAFSEEMAKANAVTSGKEAVTILLDSWRVAEDLMYAYQPQEGDSSNFQEMPVSLVIRGWDTRITPKCEFRGFVWNYQLNAVGQYWHSLYYPDLVTIKESIAQDLLRFFEEIKGSLPVPNAMLDVAWLGNGEVILIEVNPLMEGLGSFKGSTGLFDFYEDQEVLTGVKPFEIRVREREETKAEIISHMSMEWRKVVYGF